MDPDLEDRLLLNPDLEGLSPELRKEAESVVRGTGRVLGTPETRVEEDLARGLIDDVNLLVEESGGFPWVGVADRGMRIQDPVKQDLALQSAERIKRGGDVAQSALMRAFEVGELRGDDKLSEAALEAMDPLEWLERSYGKRREGALDERFAGIPHAATTEGQGLMYRILDAPHRYITRPLTEAAGLTSKRATEDIDQWTREIRENVPGVKPVSKALDVVASPITGAARFWLETARRAWNAPSPLGGWQGEKEPFRFPTEPGAAPLDWLQYEGVEPSTFASDVALQATTDPLSLVGGAFGTVAKGERVLRAAEGPLKRAIARSGLPAETAERATEAAVKELKDVVPRLGEKSGRLQAERRVRDAIAGAMDPVNDEILDVRRKATDIIREAWGPELEYIGSAQLGVRPPLVGEVGTALETLGGLARRGAGVPALKSSAVAEPLEKAGQRLREVGRLRSLSEVAPGVVPDYAGRRAVEGVRQQVARGLEDWGNQLGLEKVEGLGATMQSASMGARSRSRAEVRDGIALQERALRNALREHFRKGQIELVGKYRSIPRARKEELLRKIQDADLAEVIVDPAYKPGMRPEGFERRIRPRYYDQSGKELLDPPEELLPKNELELGFLADYSAMMNEANRISLAFGSPIGTNFNPATGQYIPRRHQPTPSFDVEFNERGASRSAYYDPRGVPVMTPEGQRVKLPQTGADFGFEAPGAGTPMGARLPREARADPADVLPEYFDNLAAKVAANWGDAKLGREFGELPQFMSGVDPTRSTLKVPIEAFDRTRISETNLPPRLQRMAHRMMAVEDKLPVEPGLEELARLHAEARRLRSDVAEATQEAHNRRIRGEYEAAREVEPLIQDRRARLASKLEEIEKKRLALDNIENPAAAENQAAIRARDKEVQQLNERVKDVRDRQLAEQKVLDQLIKDIGEANRKLKRARGDEAQSIIPVIDQLSAKIERQEQIIQKAQDKLDDLKRMKRNAKEHLARQLETEMFALDREVPSYLLRELQSQRIGSAGSMAQLLGIDPSQLSTHPLGRFLEGVGGALDMFVNHWKRLALVGRPAYNALNFVTDSTSLFLNGIDNPGRAIRETLEELRTRGKLYNELIDLGIPVDIAIDNRVALGPLVPFAGSRDPTQFVPSALELSDAGGSSKALVQAVDKPGALSTKARQAYNRAVQVVTVDNERISQAWDAMMKSTAYRFARRDLGMGEIQAIRFSNDALIDYGARPGGGALGLAERVARRFVPFTKWLFHAPGATARAAVRSPGRTVGAFRAQGNLLGGGEEGQAPAFMKERGPTYSAGPAIRESYSAFQEALGGTKLDPGEGLFVQGRGLPIAEAWNPFMQAARGNLKPLLQTTHPVITAGIEGISGRSTVTGQPVEYAPPHQLFPAGTPLVPEWSRIKKGGQRALFSTDIVPLLLGPAPTWLANRAIEALPGYDNPVTFGQTRGFRVGPPKDTMARQLWNMLPTGGVAPVYQTLPGQPEAEFLYGKTFQRLKQTMKQIKQTTTNRLRQEALAPGTTEIFEQDQEQERERETDALIEQLFGY